jgi:hypothetical protein
MTGQTPSGRRRRRARRAVDPRRRRGEREEAPADDDRGSRGRRRSEEDEAGHAVRVQLRAAADRRVGPDSRRGWLAWRRLPAASVRPCRLSSSGILPALARLSRLRVKAARPARCGAIAIQVMPWRAPLGRLTICFGPIGARRREGAHGRHCLAHPGRRVGRVRPLDWSSTAARGEPGRQCRVEGGRRWWLWR